MDNRTPLSAGTVVTLDGIGFRILELYGAGGSCLVYNAEYFDSQKNRHTVRLKEFYPASLNVTRNKDNTLEFSESTQIIKYQNRFITGARLQAEMRSEEIAVNSTAALRDILYGNGTIYSVLDFYNGRTMSSCVFDNIRQVISVLIQIASIVKKYHDAGYLHLDIKPDNIYCVKLPDSGEKTLLFDFDSIVKIEDVTNDETDLSFSAGYAAPELKNSQRKQITVRTDFYSIGCVLFFYVMNRLPNALDCRKNAHRTFNTQSGIMKNTSEKFSELLAEFFTSTISTYPNDRYKSDDELIDALNELYEAAEIKEPLLESNFAVPSTYFVGRESELTAIESAFESSKNVILSGAGGVGKSSLALHYAAQHRDRYDTIIFTRYCGSFDELIKSIPIKNIPESEPNAKLEKLRELCSERVLIIIDNFDNEDHSVLERDWLSLPCHIIVTTRMSFDIPSAVNINIGGLQEAYELFEYYCNREFDSDSKSIIRKMIYYIENHAMTTELIAKLLRNSSIQPDEVYEKLVRASLSSVEDDELRQVKDYIPKKSAIQSHIDVLYDLFAFSDDENSAMQAAALISVSSMRKDLLFRWYEFIQPITINGLIFKGWIQDNPESGLISLHPLIMDRILCHLRPEAELTKQLLRSLIKSLEKTEMQSSDIRRYILSICENAAERINGDSTELAELETAIGASYLGRRMSASRKHFQRAEQIHHNIGTQVLPEIFPVYYVVDKFEKSSYGDDLKVHLYNLDSAFKRALKQEKSFYFCLLVGRIAENIGRSTMFSDTPDDKLMWRHSAKFRELALASAASDEEKKYAAGVLYDFYSDCMNPIHSESRALKYRDAADRGVTVVYKGKELEQTEQEKQSDLIEAMYADGNKTGALLLAGKIYAKHKLTGEPLDSYLAIQLVNLMTQIKKYGAAVSILESEKNEYNCLELARLCIADSKISKAQKYLLRAEKYWLDRLKDNTDTPASLACVYILMARYFSDEEKKNKAAELCRDMLTEELRCDENMLAADCLDYAEILKGDEAEKFAYFFAGFAEVYSVSENQYQRYVCLMGQLPENKEHELTHTVFQAEYAEANDNYNKALELYGKACEMSKSQYGIDDHRTAELLRKSADLTDDEAKRTKLMQMINYCAIAEHKAALESRYSEKVRIMLQCVSDYEAVGNIDTAKNILDKITKDVGNISYDSNEYYCCLKVIQSFYADRGDYENALETAKKYLNTAPEKERADCCYDISECYRIIGDSPSQREWLDKSLELLEKMASLSSSKRRRQLDIVQQLENLYLDSGDYKNAAYYRNKYNRLIQVRI